MGFHRGPKIVRDGLVLHYDMANPKCFRGVVTTNLLNYSTMEPTNPNSVYVSPSGNTANVAGSNWHWSVYQVSEISPEGGMEWLPNEVDPLGKRGVWKMKKRTGGNSESNFYQNLSENIDSGLTYQLSVYCKTDTASTARIHTYVTENGISNWNNGSSYHTGGGEWERLVVELPANNGFTDIGAIRCQSKGTTVDANIYWKNFQIEQKNYVTKFTETSRGNSVDTGGGLFDISKNKNHGAISDEPRFYEDNRGILYFSGATEVVIPNPLNQSATGQTWTVSAWINITDKVSQQLVNGLNRNLYVCYSQGNNSLLYLNSGVDDYYTYGGDLGGIGWVMATFRFRNSDGYRTIYKNKTDITTSGPNNTSTPIGQDASFELFPGLEGYVSQICMYNTLLTDAQISQNFDAQKTRYGL